MAGFFPPRVATPPLEGREAPDTLPLVEELEVDPEERSSEDVGSRLRRFSCEEGVRGVSEPGFLSCNAELSAGRSLCALEGDEDSVGFTISEAAGASSTAALRDRWLAVRGDPTFRKVLDDDVPAVRGSGLSEYLSKYFRSR